MSTFKLISLRLCFTAYEFVKNVEISMNFSQLVWFFLYIKAYIRGEEQKIQNLIHNFNFYQKQNLCNVENLV